MCAVAMDIIVSDMCPSDDFGQNQILDLWDYQIKEIKGLEKIGNFKHLNCRIIP